MCKASSALTSLLDIKMHMSIPSELRDRHMYLFIYKALVGKLPSCITSLLNWSFRAYQTLAFSASSSSLYWARKICFYFFPSTIWNILHSSLKINSLVTLSQCKSMITRLSASVCTRFNWVVFRIFCPLIILINCAYILVLTDCSRYYVSFITFVIFLCHLTHHYK